MVIALGVTLTGEKILLGFVQTPPRTSRSVPPSSGTWWSGGCSMPRGSSA
jgi:hypothetical protein